MAPFAQHPFTEYRLYVVFHKKEGRRYAQLVKPGSKQRTTVAYARYLMSVKLGRLLRKDEHVDHKDDDKANDDIDNLQILTPRGNRQKEAVRNPEVYVPFTCNVCLNVFQLPLRQSHRVDPTCSHRCARDRQLSR